MTRLSIRTRRDRLPALAAANVFVLTQAAQRRNA